MLRLTGFPRVMVALSASWFVLFSLLPTSVRPCPMRAAGHGSTAPIEMAGHAHHAPTAPTPESHPGCDCVVTCCGAPAMPAPPPLLAVRVVVPEHLQPTTAAPRPTPRRARLLPFANGPPVLTSG